MLFTDVQRSVRLNKKKKSTNTSPYPDEAIDRLARAFYPAILACWNSEEGQREFAAWQAEQAHHIPSKEKQSVPDGERPVVHIVIVCGFWQGASAGRTLFFVLYKWLSSLRKPKRCCPRSGQTLQSRTRHCRQCGCRHAHRRSFRQRHTNRGSHFPAYQEPLRLC